MLKLSLPKLDIWQEGPEEFETIGGIDVELEHSLYTIAGWEAKWHKAFASKGGLERKELTDYICNFMCQTPDVPKSAWLTLGQKELQQISDYMQDSHSAITFKDNSITEGKRTGRKETMYAETIYWYMFRLGIPLECEHWHLNRLMTLINVCAIKSSPPKKMGKREAAAMRSKQNAALRQKLGSRG